MRKAIITLFVSLLVLGGVIFYVSTTEIEFNLREILMFLVLLIILGFAITISYKRISSARKKLPPEDEFSKKVLNKAAGTSYYISIYTWLGIMYISDKIDLETHTLIGIGIMIMALVFAVSWLICNFSGIVDA